MVESSTVARDLILPIKLPPRCDIKVSANVVRTGAVGITSVAIDLLYEKE